MAKPRVRWDDRRQAWLMLFEQYIAPGGGGLRMEIACRRWQDAINAALRMNG